LNHVVPKDDFFGNSIT